MKTIYDVFLFMELQCGLIVGDKKLLEKLKSNLIFEIKTEIWN